MPTLPSSLWNTYEADQFADDVAERERQRQEEEARQQAEEQARWEAEQQAFYERMQQDAEEQQNYELMQAAEAARIGEELRQATAQQVQQNEPDPFAGMDDTEIENLWNQFQAGQREPGSTDFPYQNQYGADVTAPLYAQAGDENRTLTFDTGYTPTPEDISQSLPSMGGANPAGDWGTPARPGGNPDLVPNQFDRELTRAEALAACGPAAAVAFARTMGRNPTMREALEIARQPGIGWTEQTGMRGPASQSELLNRMGIPNRLEDGVNWDNVRAAIEGGNPVTISTPNHYFVVDAYNPETGQFHAGRSGTAYASGAPWLTEGQIRQIGGGLQGALYLSGEGMTAFAPASADPPVRDTYAQPGATGLGNASNDLVAYARDRATQYGVDPDIFVRQITQESRWDPNAGSPAGAQGIAQIVPRFHPGVNTSDPYASLDYAARLMGNHLQTYGGDYSRALAAYNAGPGAVQQYGGVPPFAETQLYIRNILGGNVQAPDSVPYETLPQPSAGGMNPAGDWNEPPPTVRPTPVEQPYPSLGGMNPAGDWYAQNPETGPEAAAQYAQRARAREQAILNPGEALGGAVRGGLDMLGQGVDTARGLWENRPGPESPLSQWASPTNMAAEDERLRQASTRRADLAGGIAPLPNYVDETRLGTGGDVLGRMGRGAEQIDIGPLSIPTRGMPSLMALGTGLQASNEAQTAMIEGVRNLFGTAMRNDPMLQRVIQEQGVDAAFNAWFDTYGQQLGIPDVVKGLIEQSPAIIAGLAGPGLVGSANRGVQALGRGLEAVDIATSGPLAPVSALSYLNPPGAGAVGREAAPPRGAQGITGEIPFGPQSNALDELQNQIDFLRNASRDQSLPLDTRRRLADTLQEVVTEYDRTEALQREIPQTMAGTPGLTPVTRRLNEIDPFLEPALGGAAGAGYAAYGEGERDPQDLLSAAAMGAVGGVARRTLGQAFTPSTAARIGRAIEQGGEEVPRPPGGGIPPIETAGTASQGDLLRGIGRMDLPPDIQENLIRAYGDIPTGVRGSVYEATEGTPGFKPETISWNEIVNDLVPRVGLTPADLAQRWIDAPRGEATAALSSVKAGLTYIDSELSRISKLGNQATPSDLAREADLKLQEAQLLLGLRRESGEHGRALGFLRMGTQIQQARLGEQQYTQAGRIAKDLAGKVSGEIRNGRLSPDTEQKLESFGRFLEREISDQGEAFDTRLLDDIAEGRVGGAPTEAAPGQAPLPGLLEDPDVEAFVKTHAPTEHAFLVKLNQRQAHARDAGNSDLVAEIEGLRQDVLTRIETRVREKVEADLLKHKPAATQDDIREQLGKGIVANITARIKAEQIDPLDYMARSNRTLNEAQSREFAREGIKEIEDLRRMKAGAATHITEEEADLLLKELATRTGWHDLEVRNFLEKEGRWNEKFLTKMTDQETRATDRLMARLNLEEQTATDKTQLDLLKHRLDDPNDPFSREQMDVELAKLADSSRAGAKLVKDFLRSEDTATFAVEKRLREQEATATARVATSLEGGTEAEKQAYLKRVDEQERRANVQQQLDDMRQAVAEGRATQEEADVLAMRLQREEGPIVAGTPVQRFLQGIDKDTARRTLDEINTLLKAAPDVAPNRANVDALLKDLTQTSAEAAELVDRFRTKAAKAQAMKLLPGDPGKVDELGLVEMIKNLNFADSRALPDLVRQLGALQEQPHWIERMVDQGLAIRMASLLSGPGTQAINTFGSALMTGYGIGRRGAAALGEQAVTLGGRTRPAEAQLSQVGAELAGFTHGLGPAWKEAVTTFKTGISSHEIRDLRRYQADPIALPAQGLGLNYVFRSLAATDDFMRTLNYNMALMAEADRYAKATGKTADDILLDIVHNPKVVERARVEAERRTLQTPLEGLLKTISESRASPLVRGLIPFFNTLANIARVGHELSPLNLARTRAAATGQGFPLIEKATGTPDLIEAANRRGDAIIGTSLIGLGLTLAASGQLTGAGPTEPRERQAMQDTGWKPYAVLVGGNYIPIANLLGPTAIPLIIGALGFEAAQQGRDTGDWGTVAGDVVQNYGKFLLTTTGLRGVSDLVDSLSRDATGESYLENLAQSAVPYGGALSTVGRILDPEVRDPHGPLEAIQARLPLLSRGIPEKLNRWGEEQVRTATGATAALPSAGSVSARTTDPVKLEVLRLQRAGFSVLPDVVDKNVTVNGQPVELSRDQRARYQQQAGQIAHGELATAMQNSSWAGLSDARKAEYINRTTDRARQLARTPMVRNELGGSQPFKYRGVSDVQQELRIDDAVSEYEDWWRTHQGRPSQETVQLAQRYRNRYTPEYNRWRRDQTRERRTESATRRELRTELRREAVGVGT